LDIAYLRRRLPDIDAWIVDVIQQYRNVARPVASLDFKRLPGYFTRKTLSEAFFAVVDSVPRPPLTSLGLSEFADLERMDFERMDFDGITYRNFYFLRREHGLNESLHFHELVHIVQWRALGAERFLLAYAMGLHSAGEYRSNPFEQIAFDLEDRFVRQQAPFDAEQLVLQHLQKPGVVNLA